MSKIILITGTSRGLGESIQVYLNQNPDYIVYGTSRINKSDEDRMLMIDICSEESINEAIRELINKEGGLDVLINNVGTNLIGSIEDTSIIDYEKELNTNFLGTVRMVKAVLPYFEKQGYGKIINIGSIGSIFALPYNSTYSASKSALAGFSKSLAIELLHKNIQVSIVHPMGLKVDKVPRIRFVGGWNTHDKYAARMYEQMLKGIKPFEERQQVAKKIEKIIEAKNIKFQYFITYKGYALKIMVCLMPFRFISKFIVRRLLK